MEQEMVSTPVDNAPDFLQLRDKYKQDGVEDTRLTLTKSADLAAKQHVLLASDAPDAWKRPQLKTLGRQSRHWTKKERQPFGALVSGVRATGAPAKSPGENDFDAGPVQAWLTQLLKTAQGIKQSASPGGPSSPGRKPPVSLTPSVKKKLKFTPQVSTEELAQELPFSEDIAPKPWDTPTLAVKRKIRKKAALSPKRKAKVWPRKPWSGKRGKPRDGMDPETACGAPIPARRRRSQREGKLFDVQKLLNKTGMEFHWPDYQYMGPGTHVKNRLARGDPGINRLDRIAKAHDMEYDKAWNLQDKWVGDRKMIAKIDQLPGRKTLMERIVRYIMKAKLKLGM